LLLAIGLGGCLNVDSGPETAGHWGRGMKPPTVPGVQGAYGEKVPMASPYSVNPPSGAAAAAAMMSRSVPLSMVQMSGSGLMPASYAPPGGTPPGMLAPPGGFLSPPGLPFAPGMPAPGMSNMPPGAMGGMPGAMQGA